MVSETVSGPRGGGAEEHVAANNMENIGGNGGAACEVPNSPGKLLREEAKEIWKEAVADTVQYQQKLADALREEKMRQRLREAKWKRWNAAEKRKEPPSATLQLERAYKMIIDRMEAERKVATARWLAAEADFEANACELNVKTLEINRLRRELRRYTKKGGSSMRARDM